MVLELYAPKARCASGHLLSSMRYLTRVTAAIAAASSAAFEFPFDDKAGSDATDVIKQINEKMADLAKNVPDQSFTALKTSTRIMVIVSADINPRCPLTGNAGGC